MKAGAIILTLPMFTYSWLGQAKSTWINVIGVDAETRSQNYSTFFAEGQAFLNVCSKDPKRLCLSYVNPDSSLAALGSEKAVRDSLYEIRKSPGFKGKAQKAKVAQAIADALRAAVAGDQVVISLVDHGAPDYAGSSPSCIFLSELEKICENDVAEILKANPPQEGVRLLVVANACFSGGFNRLSSKSRCVVTTAPQQRVGYGSGNFWQMVQSSALGKLSEISRVRNRDTAEVRLASEFGMHQGCLAAHQELRKFHYADLDEETLISMRTGILQAVSDPAKSCFAKDSKLRFAREINAFVESLKKYEFGETICKTASSGVCEKVKRFIESGNRFAHLESLVQVSSQSAKLSERFYADLAQASGSLSISELELANLESPEKTSAFSKLPSLRKIAVKQAHDRMRKLSQEMESACGNLQITFDRAMADLPFFGDISELLPCFEGIISPEDPAARDYEEKVMSPADIEDARSCEQAFTF